VGNQIALPSTRVSKPAKRSSSGEISVTVVTGQWFLLSDFALVLRSQGKSYMASSGQRYSDMTRWLYIQTVVQHVSVQTL